MRLFINIHRHFLTLLVISTTIAIAAGLAFASSYWLIKYEVRNDSHDLVMFVDGRLQAAYKDLQRLDQVPYQKCDTAGRTLLQDYLFDSINSDLFFVRSLEEQALHYCSVLGDINFERNAANASEIVPVANLKGADLVLGEYEWHGLLRRDLFMLYQDRQVNLRRLPLMENYPFYEIDSQNHRRVHVHLSNGDLVMTLGNFNQSGLSIVSVESRLFPFTVTAVVSVQRVLALAKFGFLAFVLLLSLFVLLVRHSLGVVD